MLAAGGGFSLKERVIIFKGFFKGFRAVSKALQQDISAFSTKVAALPKLPARAGHLTAESRSVKDIRAAWADCVEQLCADALDLLQRGARQNIGFNETFLSATATMLAHFSSPLLADAKISKAMRDFSDDNKESTLLRLRYLGPVSEKFRKEPGIVYENAGALWKSIMLVFQRNGIPDTACQRWLLEQYLKAPASPGWDAFLSGAYVLGLVIRHEAGFTPAYLEPLTLPELHKRAQPYMPRQIRLGEFLEMIALLAARGLNREPHQLVLDDAAIEAFPEPVQMVVQETVAKFPPPQQEAVAAFLREVSQSFGGQGRAWRAIIKGLQQCYFGPGDLEIVYAGKAGLITYQARNTPRMGAAKLMGLASTEYVEKGKWCTATEGDYFHHFIRQGGLWNFVLPDGRAFQMSLPFGQLRDVANGELNADDIEGLQALLAQMRGPTTQARLRFGVMKLTPDLESCIYTSVLQAFPRLRRCNVPLNPDGLGAELTLAFELSQLSRREDAQAALVKCVEEGAVFDGAQWSGLLKTMIHNPPKEFENRKDRITNCLGDLVMMDETAHAVLHRMKAGGNLPLWVKNWLEDWEDRYGTGARGRRRRTPPRSRGGPGEG